MDRLDAEQRGHILEAIRGSNHSVVAAIANLVREVTGHPLRTTENAEEVFPRLLWLYRDSDFVQRVIQEVFPSHLAGVVSDIRKRTDPSAEDIHTAIAVARTMEQGLQEQSYFETLRDFMNRKTAERNGTGSEEGEQIARWVSETLGISGVLPRENWKPLVAGQELIVSSSGKLQVPILARVTRISADSPRSRNIQKKRIIAVEEGFLPAEVVEKLKKYGSVQEIGPGQISEAVTQVQQKRQQEGSDTLKDLFVAKTGSDLETTLNQELDRLKDSWDLPMAVVSLPLALLPQLSSNDLTLYLLNILVQADPIPQRRMERLESIWDTGAEFQLLSTRA